MTFITEQFILFFSVVLLLYYLIPKRFQWILLLLASYLFYYSWGIGGFIYLLITTATIFFAGLAIGKLRQKPEKSKKDGLNKDIQKLKRLRSFITIAAMVINIGILVFFKYFNFIVTRVNASAGLQLPVIDLIMPLGISFYTFQSVGYLIDVSRGKILPDTNLAKFALFVSFFPQILQGPISRHSDIAHQLYDGHEFDYTNVKYGLLRILWGFFKKLVIADRAMILVNNVIGNYQMHQGLELVFGMIIFMLQIYADFSGGIDIAIGIAQCMGIILPENFMRPHFATSVEDYWRRWHITLGRWMKEYVFYPLALSKTFTKLGRTSRKTLGNYLGKLLPTSLAMIIVFLLVGAWHGTSLKNIAFGLYNGFWIVLTIILTPLLKKLNERWLHIDTSVFSWRALNIVLTFFIILISKVFGVAPSLTDSLGIIKRMFSSFNPWIFTDGTLTTFGLDTANLVVLALSTSVFIFVSVMQESGIRLRDTLSRQNTGFRWIFYIFAVLIILIFGVYGVGYNAADFFYMHY
jgi:D-alanyl-lipoteichoic acid acyltransferase DltB (MBOAT superfamily)